MMKNKDKVSKAHAIDFKMLPMDIGRLVASPLKLVFRIKRKGEAAKAIKGCGAIIVANHVSFLDPMIVLATFWQRRLHYLVGEVVMENPVRGLLMRGLGCIKIDRNISDIDAMRKAVNVLKRGRCIAMFPQGGIKSDDGIKQIKSGAILLALQADVPIVPVYFERRNHWYERQRVVVGEPLNCRELCTKKFPSMSDINRLNDELLCRMNRCSEEYSRMGDAK